MSDRELLELAAKAAGIKLNWPECDYPEIVQPNILGVLGVWNPLTDDGDALRLAVKLQLGIAVYDHVAAAMDGEGVDLYEHIYDDPYAATRRAIVRAAAEIGRSKE